MKRGDHVNGNEGSGLGMKLLWDESSQGEHKTIPTLSHGISRTETNNCPSFLIEPCPFKDATQSYYYSSEDEFKRVERKEK